MKFPVTAWRKGEIDIEEGDTRKAQINAFSMPCYESIFSGMERNSMVSIFSGMERHPWL